MRWTENGKPKEAFRRKYNDAVALQASITALEELQAQRLDLLRVVFNCGD